MGCPVSVDIGDNLVFSVTTHDPQTGVLTDADVDPVYRLYEDETAVPILTGNLSKLDDVNTTGFYTEQVACTPVNGFEDGKTYTIYITATVGGDTGGICYAFKAVEIAAKVPGAQEFTYTVANTNTGLPLAGVNVYITTDIAGLNVIWSGVTDVFGVARDNWGNLPWLVNGTYYFWKNIAGFTDDQNPDTEVVP